MTKAIKRMWINQPSTLQPHHALHGTNVLAQHEYDDTIRIYFLSGDKVSQQVSKLALSEGWRPDTPTSEAAPTEQRSQAMDYRATAAQGYEVDERS